jgi:hypothetical protein
MKIFIDSNIFLDFYRSTTEAIQIFDALIASAESVLITDQIIDEFFRNREVVIRAMKVKFLAEFSPEHFSSSFLKSIPEFNELVKIRDSFGKKRKELEKRIMEMIEHPENDPVVGHFEKLTRSKVILLKRSPAIIQSAHYRKLIGNPPVSDKYTIGDEINWELLLQGAKDDLVLVARDSTFRDNLNFLKREFHHVTGKSIVEVSTKITTAIEMVGQKPSTQLVEIEDRQIEELGIIGKWSVVSTNGNIAIVTDGSQTGAMPIDTNRVHPSFQCGHCGSWGPWNGARCMTCGMLDDGD